MVDEPNVRVEGVVKWFDGGKGYGFLNFDEDQPDVFVHAKNLPDECARAVKGPDGVERMVKCLHDNQAVSFEIEHNGRDKAGRERLRAINVQLL